ncbi:uncharacterized protein LOC111628406, partial [Centruroides sculpturatus]|uniref:uncharacterized protein LOC111628406 n=1 Tax=Centruroides sculpturatus TaxID=218467 RepID=UPI000C6EC4E1
EILFLKFGLPAKKVGHPWSNISSGRSLSLFNDQWNGKTNISLEESEKILTKIPDDNEKGYILEVDLEYPKESHDYHSDLPLAPENKIPDGSKQTKLLTTLYDKNKYVLHYRNLKQYLKMGMKLKKIHRVLEFKQSDWLKKYIDLNTEMQTKATNDFEKDFYKLMNNSVFGKTMENIRSRVDIRLCCEAKKVEKLIAKPNFKHLIIFTENLCAIHMYKK